MEVCERRGREVAPLLFGGMQPEPEAVARRFLSVSPDGGDLYPHDAEAAPGRFTIAVHACPLKQAWLDSGLAADTVATLCRIAGAFDKGLFEGAGLGFENSTWSEARGGGCCRITLRALATGTPGLLLDTRNGALWGALQDAEEATAAEVTSARDSVLSAQRGGGGGARGPFPRFAPRLPAAPARTASRQSAWPRGGRPAAAATGAASGGGGSGAILRPRINGVVTAVTITDPGSDYSSTPVISFVGGGAYRSSVAGQRYYANASAAIAIGAGQIDATLSAITRLGVTELLAALADPVPVTFVARTVKVYAVPLVKPDTVIGEDAPVPVNPPGLEVTV
jgi:hypothetical protein